MEPKFKNINLQRYEINLYPKREELGEIIEELITNRISSENIDLNKRRKLEFLNESGIIVKISEGKKVEYILSYYARLLIEFVLENQILKLKELAEFLEDSTENVVYYLLIFTEMRVFLGEIDYLNKKFYLKERKKEKYIKNFSSK